MTLIHPPNTVELKRLGLRPLTRRCAEESERFFSRQDHDPCYCSEMLRRAIVNRDPQAWSCVYQQYRPLVASWVHRHTDVATSGEDVDYFVNLAFTRFWQSLTPDRFALSPDLKSTLRYLATCVHSAIVDHVRAQEAAALALPTPDMADADMVDADMDVESETLAALQGTAVWEAIRRRLNGDKEELVMYYAYVVGLKPREICAHLPDQFTDVDEVYTVKETVLTRLRRDGELKRHIGKCLSGASN